MERFDLTAAYGLTIALLTEYGDVELAKIGSAARSFFLNPDNAPVVLDPAELSRAVRLFVPTPFALAFERWSSDRDSFNEDNATGETLAERFDKSFAGVWECWRQLVHFMPFVLLAALRLRDDLQQRGGKILARAFSQYEAFYRLADEEKESERRKLEGQQCQLLENLIELCADLDKSRVEPASFFFDALMVDGLDFEALFPKRFTIELKFIQSTRNRIEHGRIGRRPPDALRAVHRLIESAFVDIVGTVVRLSQAYGIYHIDAIDEAEEDAVAHAFAFSGVLASHVRFAVASGGIGNANAEKFVPNHTYLIDRRRELRPDRPPASVEPRDYVDLTPFIVERGRIDRSVIATDRRLYALDQYRSAERSRFISFLELTGEALRRLPGSEKASSEEIRELAELLGEIDEFSSRVESLADYILQKRRGKMDFPILRRRAWERVSKSHLDSVVDVRSFTYAGEPVDGAADIPLCSYDARLYESPAEARHIDSFFESKKRGLLLIGGSGYGKTTLLARCLLERLSAGDVAIFLSGRRLLKGSLRDILVDVTSSIGYEWTPVDLDAFVRDENAMRKLSGKAPTQITVFIDAVNEYTAASGAPELLRDIIEFVTTGGDKMFGQKVTNFRLIATCRTETWAGCRDQLQHAFDRESFYSTPGGQPITISGFDDDAMRAALYQRYRVVYGLSRTPYEELAPAVSDLFRSPLMLALVAEAYGTKVRGEVGRRIPKQLNYYSVFNALKRRKLEACEFLLPTEAKVRREGFIKELEACLLTFATLLYKRLTHGIDPRDYVAIEQTTRKPFSQYNSDRMDRQVATFRALREVGIITSKAVAEIGANGVERQGKAFTFFHDRYAEYELGDVYAQSVLGRMNREASGDPKTVKRVADEVERLVRSSTRFPVLSGALDHWFAIMLNGNTADIAALIPLCNRLAQSESGSVRSKASEVLTHLVLRGSLAARDLYRAAFAMGSSGLRVDLSTALAEAWPGVASEIPAALLEACNPARDELAIETLADAFAEHVNAKRLGGDGSTAIEFVASFTPDLSGLLRRLLDLDRVKTHLKFIVRFSQITIVTCAERPAILMELRAFLIGRFRPIVDFIIGNQSGNSLVDWAPGKLRDFLREQFERSMYAGWDDGISCDGVNDSFFVSENNVVQRDVMLEYMPFMCAVHNRDFETLSMEEGSRFLELSLDMLNYRKYSIIGFAAYASITIAVRNDVAAIRRIVSKLMSEGTEAGRFVAINIVESYCEVDRSFAHEGLQMAEEMLPHLADEGDALSHLLVCAAGIVEANIASNWPYLVPSLDAAFAHLTRRGTLDQMHAFGREMRCMTFFGDSRIGTRFIEYVIDAGYLDERSDWRPAVLEICAGMAARDRGELMRLFSQYGISEKTVRESEALRTQDVLDQQRTFGTRARWNIFFVRALAFNTKLRYLLVKHMFCSIALCNEVEEWATQMGTFMIEGIRAYAHDADDSERYAHLSVADIKASTPVRPKPGGGKRYVPRRKALAAKGGRTAMRAGQAR